MADAARDNRPYSLRWSVNEYFGFVHQGGIHPDERVELLDGLVVAMSPQDPRHAAAIMFAGRALERLLRDRATLRNQLPLILGDRSVPEPDLAIVPGGALDYVEAHPTTALLVVEVSDSSLPQDRLTKAAIYARGGVPEYWIVNLVDDRVDVFREPLPRRGRYRRICEANRGERLEVVAFPGESVAVDDLVPPRRR
jgi:Uma2 family endonuclease